MPATSPVFPCGVNGVVETLIKEFALLDNEYISAVLATLYEEFACELTINVLLIAVFALSKETLAYTPALTAF